jgi:hypothetical protein
MTSSTHLTSNEAALLKDLELSRQSWLDTVDSAVSSRRSLDWSENSSSWERIAARLTSADDKAALVAVFNEVLAGQCHSFLATLDGATDLAEVTMLEVCGNDGKPFRKQLHEYWPQFSGTEA